MNFSLNLLALPAWPAAQGLKGVQVGLLHGLPLTALPSYQLPQCWLGKPAAPYKFEQQFRWLPTDGPATRKLRALCCQTNLLLVVMAPAVRNVIKLSSCCCRS